MSDDWAWYAAVAVTGGPVHHLGFENGALDRLSWHPRHQTGRRSLGNRIDYVDGSSGRFGLVLTALVATEMALVAVAIHRTRAPKYDFVGGGPFWD